MTPTSTTRTRRPSSARRAPGRGRTCRDWWCHTPTTRRSSATSCGATSSPRGRPRSTLKMMVTNYKASGYSLKPVLGVILRSPAMYANLDSPDLIKPPIVFVVANMRHRGKYIDQNSWTWLLDGMGQQPFYPPNVSGWNQNTAWLNTNSAKAYWRTTGYLLNTPPDPGEQSRRRRRRRGAQGVRQPVRLADHAAPGSRRMPSSSSPSTSISTARPRSTCCGHTTGSSGSRCCAR